MQIKSEYLHGLEARQQELITRRQYWVDQATQYKSAFDNALEKIRTVEILQKKNDDELDRLNVANARANHAI